MRSILKLGVPVAVAALALTACGGTSSSDNASSAPKEVKIGFFGALTGDAANLGQNIKKGAQLAIDQYNATSPKTKITLVDFDSQGDPAQAPALAKKAVDDKSVIGIVGPAFSGESKAADPLFNEAGLVTISASATNPALSTNGWKTFFRVLGNDASQGPAAAKYIQNVLQAKKVVVVDDASEYGKGLANIVKSTLGSTVVATDTIQQKQTDFGPTVTKIKSANADAVFFGGYYAEAGLIKKQMTDAGITAKFVVGDGVKDDGYITAAGAKAAEGTIMTCPCLPPDKAGGTFYTDYKKAFNADPATYGAEAYDAASIIIAAVKAGKTSRADVVAFTKAYDQPGVTKQLKFDDKGEPTNVTVWAYKVEGGKIVPDQEVK
ncbi:branched-chain amino acid ABC transporter substrate-binding protein [Angustibacter sp. McL0619]|uniref:branched-chain amino acid ABC transporter substrate-binding protein n=1 Tax=Angustibacter sp. McL0619 TaxID=3415676 RepID=UPI003CEE2535